MGNQQHLEWLLEGIDAWNARREKEPFNPDLSGYDLSSEQFACIDNPIIWLASYGMRSKRINLDNANLENANLRGRDLYGGSFVAANLKNANLRTTKLTWASFRNADLKKANLSDADAGEANFHNADLRGAVFNGTYLRAAFFPGALVSSTFDHDGNISVTDLSKAKWLTQSQIDHMKGDIGTLFPTRLKRPQNWEIPLEAPEDENSVSPFEAPIINAAAVDFELSSDGIAARVPDGQQISDNLFSGDCENRRLALIENSRDIASSINNRLGEATRNDLNAYWQHLHNSEPANPHRLDFLAKGIEADASDPLVSEGFDTRLKRQLEMFQHLHKDFLSECVPDAAQALQFKKDLRLERPVSKEEATTILNDLEEAIRRTEAATQSVQDFLTQLRNYDDQLNAFQIKAFSEKDHDKLSTAVETETKELVTVISRLYWRARQVLGTAGTVSWRAGEGTAILCSVSGKSLTEISTIITTRLEPLMRNFADLVNGLPPL